MPERIQQRRVRGWRKPENTRGVARPSRYGNPFRIGHTYPVVAAEGVIVDYADAKWVFVRDAAQAVEMYRDWITDRIRMIGSHSRLSTADLKSIRGMNLMCFCPLDQPCHADVLLKLANQGGNDA